MWTNTRKKTMSATKQINSLAEVKCLAVATAGKRKQGSETIRRERTASLFVFLFLSVRFVLLFSRN